MWRSTCKGNEVDVDRLAVEALAVRRAQHGAVDPALDALLVNAPGEPRTVVIWLREQSASKLPERPEAAGKPLEPSEIDRVYADLDARRTELVAPLVDAVLADVLRFDERAIGLTPTPAIAATLDARQIGELAADERIEMIYDAPVATADLGVAKQTTGVTQVHGTGLDGTGVRVGIVEVGGRTESASWLMRPVQQNTTNVCANPTQHTTNVTSVIAGQRVNVFGQIVGEDGVSKRADVLVGGSCTGVTAELQAAATRAADWGARTINLSWGSDSNLAIGASDRFFDEMVHNRWRTIVKSAGNRNCGNTGGPGGTPDADVTSPGLGYNVVTVGGLDDMGTAQWSDDTMYACSSFGDPTSRNGDREKPELVAPAANIEMVDPGPANLFVDSGTSFAAPQVTGVTALLMQQNSRLTIWPEITRAILMASATHNIEGATRLSDQDGAGGMAANRRVRHRRQHDGVERRRVRRARRRTPSISPPGPWGGAPTTESRSRGPPTRRSPTTTSDRAPTSICRSSTISATSSPRRRAGTTPPRSSSSTRGRPAPTQCGRSTSGAIGRRSSAGPGTRRRCSSASDACEQHDRARSDHGAVTRVRGRVVSLNGSMPSRRTRRGCDRTARGARRGSRSPTSTAT